MTRWEIITVICFAVDFGAGIWLSMRNARKHYRKGWGDALAAIRKSTGR